VLASIMRDWDDPRCGRGFTFRRCWWGISNGSIVSVGSPGGWQIRWRCGGFCRLDWTSEPPDRSTISRTRRLINIDTHREVFSWVLGQNGDC
jgi:hypothetical protein